MHHEPFGGVGLFCAPPPLVSTVVPSRLSPWRCFVFALFLSLLYKSSRLLLRFPKEVVGSNACLTRKTLQPAMALVFLYGRDCGPSFVPFPSLFF